MSSNDSISDREDHKGHTSEPSQVARRNPIHYTDTQIVKMIGATATGQFLCSTSQEEEERVEHGSC